MTEKQSWLERVGLGRKKEVKAPEEKKEEKEEGYATAEEDKKEDEGEQEGPEEMKEEDIIKEDKKPISINRKILKVIRNKKNAVKQDIKQEAENDQTSPISIPRVLKGESVMHVQGADLKKMFKVSHVKRKAKGAIDVLVNLSVHAMFILVGDINAVRQHKLLKLSEKFKENEKPFDDNRDYKNLSPDRLVMVDAELVKRVINDYHPQMKIYCDASEGFDKKHKRAVKKEVVA